MTLCPVCESPEYTVSGDMCQCKRCGNEFAKPIEPIKFEAPYPFGTHVYIPRTAYGKFRDVDEYEILAYEISPSGQRVRMLPISYFGISVYRWLTEIYPTKEAAERSVK